MDRSRQSTLEHGVHPPGEEGDRGRVGTLVRTPFHQGFIDDLKGEFLPEQRAWFPDEEVWWVEAGHETYLEELVIHHYGHVKVVDEDGGEMLRDRDGDYEQTGLW